MNVSVWMNANRIDKGVLVMKVCALVLSMVFILQKANAEISTEEFEGLSIVAMTNNEVLCSGTFSNQILSALATTDLNLRVDGCLMRGIRARHMFLETAESVCLQEERAAVSNAVVLTDDLSDNWRKWVSRLMYAGCYASEDSFAKSYAMLTNGLMRMTAEGFTGSTNRLSGAILRKFEMGDVSILTAYKVMAGMSAAELGLRTDAQAYASQVPTKFADLISGVLNSGSH